MECPHCKNFSVYTVRILSQILFSAQCLPLHCHNVVPFFLGLHCQNVVPYFMKCQHCQNVASYLLRVYTVSVVPCFMKCLSTLHCQHVSTSSIGSILGHQFPIFYYLANFCIYIIYGKGNKSLRMYIDFLILFCNCTSVIFITLG